MGECILKNVYSYEYYHVKKQLTIIAAGGGGWQGGSRHTGVGAYDWLCSEKESVATFHFMFCKVSFLSSSITVAAPHMALIRGPLWQCPLTSVSCCLRGRTSHAHPAPFQGWFWLCGECNDARALCSMHMRLHACTVCGSTNVCVCVMALMIQCVYVCILNGHLKYVRWFL